MKMDKFVVRGPTWKTVSYQTVLKNSLKAKKEDNKVQYSKKPLQEKQSFNLYHGPSIEHILTNSWNSSEENCSEGKNYDYMSCRNHQKTTTSESPISIPSPSPLNVHYPNSDKGSTAAVGRQVLPSPYSNTGKSNSDMASSQNNAMQRIQRDLSSPSATVRMRALKALKNPSKSTYSHFDVPYAEQSIILAEDRKTPPPTPSIQELMCAVVVYVEVRSGEDNRSEGVKKVISELGARVNHKLLRDTTHVIFKDGLLSTYKKARNWSIPVVSILWIEACKNQHKICDPNDFPISNIDRYENPELYEKMKRHISMQPESECNKRIRAKPATPKDSTPRTTRKAVKLTQRMEDGTPTSTSKKKTDISHFFKKLSSTANSSTKTDTEITKMATVSMSVQITSNCSVAIATESTPGVDSNKLNDEGSKDYVACMDATFAGQTVPKAKKLLNMDEENSDDFMCSSTKHEKVMEKISLVQTPLEKEPILKSGRTTSRRCSMYKAANISTCSEDMSIDRSIFQSKTCSETISPMPTPNRPIRRRSTTHTITNTSSIVGNESTPVPVIMKGKTFPSDLTDIVEGEPIGLPNEKVKLLPNTPSKRAKKRYTTFTNTPLDNSDTSERNSNNVIKRRRTLYTPQKMEESLLAERPHNTEEPPSKVNILSSAVNANEVKLQMPIIEKFDSSELPNNTTQQLIDSQLGEPDSPLIFSSTRQPGRRRTIFDVSMDIITQRMQNINKSARRSTAAHTVVSDLELRRNSLDQTNPMLSESLTSVQNMHIQMAVPDRSDNDNANEKTREVEINSSNAPPGNTKKRKLYVANESFQLLTPTQPTTTADLGNAPRLNVKRRQTLLPPASKKLTQVQRRRSNNTQTSEIQNPVCAPTPENKKLQYLVYTNMHKEQIKFIQEAIEKLDGFELEDNVSEATTHVVSLEPRRTLNLLRGLVRGLWILEFSWVTQSLEAGNWLSEEQFELKDFSRAVEICRAEHQAFGCNYKCELFSELAPFYVPSRCGPLAANHMKELITTCGGKIADHRKRAKYILGNDAKGKALKNKICISPYWILDSITKMQLLKLHKYECTHDPQPLAKAHSPQKEVQIPQSQI